MVVDDDVDDDDDDADADAAADDDHDHDHDHDDDVDWMSFYIIYLYRLKAGGSPELRGTLSLDAIPERSFLYTDGGGGGKNV